ncbi:MAG: hypothetical protein MUO63_19890, partial [Desulfobulbaceae bacterium]|nr:hypothetical protein [Desulfobulbaceae bacterium]
CCQKKMKELLIETSNYPHCPLNEFTILQGALKNLVSGSRTRSGENKKRSILGICEHCSFRRDAVIGPEGNFPRSLHLLL